MKREKCFPNKSRKCTKKPNNFNDYFSFCKIFKNNIYNIMEVIIAGQFKILKKIGSGAFG